MQMHFWFEYVKGRNQLGYQRHRHEENVKTDFNFMVTPCINNAEPFYYQLLCYYVTMLKNTELLKHSKITLQYVSVYIETIFRELKSVLG